MAKIDAGGRLNPASAMYLLLSLTRRCNMRCPNCFFAMQSADFFEPYDIVFDDAVEIIDYYARLGIRQVLEELRGVMRRQDYQIGIFLPNLLGLARPPFYCNMLSSIVIGANGDFAPCCRIAPAQKWGNFFIDADRHNNDALREFRHGFFKAQTQENLPAICRTCGYLSQHRPVFVRQQQQWVNSTAF